jgi:hypothetical protein
MGTSAGTEESVGALSSPSGMLLRWDGPREHHIYADPAPHRRVRIWTSQFRIYAVDSGRAKATCVPSRGTNEMNTATRKVLPPRAHQLFG